MSPRTCVRLLFTLVGLSAVHGSPLPTAAVAEAHSESHPSQSCIAMVKPEHASCMVCYESACQVTYEEAIASFGHALHSDSLLQNSSLLSGFHELPESSTKGNHSHCPSTVPPNREAEYGCMHVPSIDSDGCVMCYSYACLHCNRTDSHAINISLEVEVSTHDSDAHPIRINSKLKVAMPDHCPLVAPHSNELSADSQDCIYVPQRGEDGCILSYNLVCPETPSTHAVDHTSTETPSTQKCPIVKRPAKKPAAGCVYAERFDDRGCLVSFDTICSTPSAGHRPSPKSPSTPRPGHRTTTKHSHHRFGPSDWRWMLGDAYKGAASQDARKFRPMASAPIPSSGHFVACKRQSDCFHYREPKEWCIAASSNSSLYAWTDKSCYCAHDTERRACIIERVNLRSKMVEWTFCSPKKDFVCA